MEMHHMDDRISQWERRYERRLNILVSSIVAAIVILGIVALVKLL
jgi:hypothetical protein